MAAAKEDQMNLINPQDEAMEPLKNTISVIADARFDRIISEVDEYAILLLDLNGNILSWNKGAEKIKGYTADEIIGKSFKRFYSKEDIEARLPDTLLQQAFEKGKATHEGWRIRKDGHRFWGSITITALHDEFGKVNGYLKLTRDLTDKKATEDRYNNMLEELRLKNDQLRCEEERYHKMVAEVRDYAIILLDGDGNIIDWNKGAEHLKGYRADEIVGTNFRLFYSIEDRENNLPERLLEEATRLGHVNHEGFRVRKDGTRFWGSVAITALHDDHGKIIGFSKVTKDLTERKATEDQLAIFTQELKQSNEELRRSEERYQKMISEVQDYAILLLNTNGDILNWNTGAELIKGYQASEIVGKNFRLFYLPEDIQNGLPETLLKQARDTGKATSEGWRRRKDGSQFWASIVITALHDSAGNIMGFSKVTRDLTERKLADDALKQYAEQLEAKNYELERLNNELSSFAYVVSHDLKEPVRKIRVFASRQLEEENSLKEMRAFSEKIIASAEHMYNLMESLLSYSRISNDDTSKEKVDLNKVLSAVENDLELLIHEKKADIKTDKLPIINGVPFQMHQLFLNLISNSIKFRHRDRSPSITISCKTISNGQLPESLVKGEKYNCITFADNGIGFEPGQREKIFDVFKTLQPKSVAEGTGIGLAIVKKVVQNHYGEVNAEAVPDGGAKFHVYLPVN